jgi:hypothetical protein
MNLKLLTMYCIYVASLSPRWVVMSHWGGNNTCVVFCIITDNQEGRTLVFITRTHTHIYTHNLTRFPVLVVLKIMDYLKQ